MKPKKTFFDRFARQDKNVSRSLSLPQGDWDLIEAYRMFGESRLGFEISLNTLIHELVVNQISSDRDFDVEKWQGTIVRVRSAGSEGSVEE